MIARSLDIYALAKLTLEEGSRPYAVVAGELEMSASEFHAAVKRLGQAGLVDPKDRRIRQGAVREFLIHGLRYVFLAGVGGLTRGVLTSYAAPPLSVLRGCVLSAFSIWYKTPSRSAAPPITTDVEKGIREVALHKSGDTLWSNRIQVLKKSGSPRTSEISGGNRIESYDRMRLACIC